MAEFVRPEDWGLQAIVRGSTKTEFWTAPSTDTSSCFTDPMEMPKDDCHNLLFNFPCLFDTASMLTDELQELYKPFYSVSCTSPSQNSLPDPTATTISSFSVRKERKEEPEPDQTEEIREKVAHMDKTATAATASYTPKYKRRKNQNKRVVLQVTAEDLTSDKWAWRKYGQKPIKGSPYPRSYYRCSSSKGCLARKQVEQSCTDPGTFIITYTGEHSHSQPTRKNALAGTIRHKFGTTTKNPINDTNSKEARNGDSGRCSTSPTPFLDLSPVTPFVAEEESVEKQMNNKDETDHIQDELINRKNRILMPEVMFDDDDDFFSCLNDLDGFISQLGESNCSTGTLSSESDFL